MRKLLAGLVTGAALLLAGQAIAADMPYYPPVIEIPDVDYGVSGSFYLRGSVAGNILAVREYVPACPLVACAGGPGPFPATNVGYGYSFGAGIGYETGTGLRADVTVDHGYNEGAGDAAFSLGLRSTILLANAYYDFPISGSGMGGFGAYVGAGVGGGYLQTTITGSGAPTPDGSSWAPAGALMAGVTYDMGSVVADLGYRALYIPQFSNAQIGPNTSFYANNSLQHEARLSLRYRFN